MKVFRVGFGDELWLRTRSSWLKFGSLDNGEDQDTYGRWATVSPLATRFRPGEIGLMGRPCTHESLGGKQGKPGGLVVQTPGAKCGDRGCVRQPEKIWECLVECILH